MLIFQDLLVCPAFLEQLAKRVSLEPSVELETRALQDSLAKRVLPGSLVQRDQLEPLVLVVQLEILDLREAAAAPDL